ncbi:MAG: hypothetical protein GY859_30150, partial [Desulfobacterales bacterium]|nr:hypothetical protein [Desulfobacterales bacterium]
LILPGVRVGFEGPATIQDCLVGPDAALNGGFFKGAVFLKGSSMGLGAHVRDGTILEEYAKGAHTVALKQTILMPFVTLGSLINFCDCLMAGGTDNKNHSEVGSSYIHFNYTPNQDKATASLLGDVPHGVMLNQRPIFLGGQGGVVGPCRLWYGAVAAAGTIWRKDETRPGRLLFGGGMKMANIPFRPGAFSGERRIIHNNLLYIGNLAALGQWCGHVRRRFISDDLPAPLWEGLKETLDKAMAERVKQLKKLSLVMKAAAEADGPDSPGSRKRVLSDRWPEVEGVLKEAGRLEGDHRRRDLFLEKIEKDVAARGKAYVPVIQALSPADAENGVQWLQGIVDAAVDEALSIVPEYK